MLRCQSLMAGLGVRHARWLGHGPARGLARACFGGEGGSKERGGGGRGGVQFRPSIPMPGFNSDSESKLLKEVQG